MYINQNKPLSKENRDKVCMTGIYSLEPVRDWFKNKDDIDIHWCKNWTFAPYENIDGQIVMYDTYYSSEPTIAVVLDDEMFEKFKFEYDTTKVRRVNPKEFYKYDEEDRYHLPIDSGGSEFNKNYFVRKGAEPSIHKRLNKICEDIDKAMRDLEYLKRDKEALIQEMGQKNIKPKITPRDIHIPTYEQLMGINSFNLKADKPYLVMIDEFNDKDFTDKKDIPVINENGEITKAQDGHIYLRPVIYFPEDQTKYDECHIIYNAGKGNEISFTIYNDGRALCDNLIDFDCKANTRNEWWTAAERYLNTTFLKEYGIELNGLWDEKDNREDREKYKEIPVDLEHDDDFER